MHSLAMLGAGNMGAAIVRGALRTGVLQASDVLVIEPDDARRVALAALGCATSSAAADAADAEQIVLAVKPQAFNSVAAALGTLQRDTVVISIMAGIESAAIREALGECARVVRTMPNTPCQIGAGMTAIALGAGARPGDEALALRLFAAVGRVEPVDESLMHAVTAVSGSGPAYLFHLAEAMERAALALGFAPAQARVFVAETLFGASMLLRESESNAAELRAAVTSKGGTTEAALGVLTAGGFVDLIVRALTAARDRGAELGTGPGIGPGTGLGTGR